MQIETIIPKAEPVFNLTLNASEVLIVLALVGGTVTSGSLRAAGGEGIYGLLVEAAESAGLVTTDWMNQAAGETVDADGRPYTATLFSHLGLNQVTPR